MVKKHKRIVAFSEADIDAWFVKNYKLLGFDKILKRQWNKTPDYIMLKNGKKVKVELEFKASDFILHKHSPKDVDIVYCGIKDVTLPVKTVELSKYIKAVPGPTPEEVIDWWIKQRGGRSKSEREILEEAFGKW